MTKIIRGAMAGLVVAWVASGCAGTKEAKRDVGAAIPGVSEKGEGLIQDIGRNQISVVGIAGQTSPVWFVVAPDTEIVRSGQRVDWSELQPGMPVRVSYETAAGPERAFKIEVLTGGEAAKVRTDVQERAYGGAGTQGRPGSKQR